MTLPTAVWQRRDDVLSVVRIELPALWLGSLDGYRMFVTTAHGYAMLVKALHLCRNGMLLHFCGVPGDLEWPTEGVAGGTLLICTTGTHVSLKEWRAVRDKLHFQPKRWQIPKKPDPDAAFERFDWNLQSPSRGKTEDDGTTFLLRLDKQALLRFAYLWDGLAEVSMDAQYYCIHLWQCFRLTDFDPDHDLNFFVRRLKRRDGKE